MVGGPLLLAEGPDEDADQEAVERFEHPEDQLDIEGHRTLFVRRGALPRAQHEVEDDGHDTGIPLPRVVRLAHGVAEDDEEDVDDDADDVSHACSFSCCGG